VQTRAAIFHSADRPLEVRDVELDGPRAGEVVVRMAAIGICGSDLHLLKGEWPSPVPIVPGHEGAGIVEAVGEGVESLAAGDPVVVSWASGCGSCPACRRHRPALCVPLRRAWSNGTLIDGTSRISSGGEEIFRALSVGALAEHVLVPAGAALRIPGEVSLAEASVLGCAALTGIGAVRNAAGVRAGDTALVIGAGGVGQFTIEGLRLAGASVIVAVDPAESRLERALAAGATHAVVPDDLKALVKAELPELFDHAFDVVGAPATQASAVRWTRDGGTVVFVGLPAAGAKLELDSWDLVTREKKLVGTIYGSADPAEMLPDLLATVKAGKLDLGELVGTTYPLDAVNEAVAESIGGAPRRVLVTP
jgi:S-(hydroxymethyl)glutathione dehydrogenase/alcohol dehydrogenase